MKFHRPRVLIVYAVVLLLAPGVAAREYAPEVVYHLDSGNKLLRDGNLTAARVCFEDALKLDPRCPEAHNNIGLCLLRDGALEKAGDEFKSALKIDPMYMPSLNNLGSVMYRQHQYDEALEYYQQASTVAKDQDAEVLTNIGNVLRDKGDYVGAIDRYRQAIKLQPDSPASYNNLGLTLYRMHKLNDAMVQVTKAIELRPGYSEALYNLGLIQRDSGNNGQAITAFQDSLKYETNKDYANDTRKRILELSNPTTPAGHLDKGYTYLEKARWRKAQSEFEQATSAPGGDGAIAWNNLGLCLANQGQLLEAIEDYKKAIKINGGTFPAAQYNLGQAYRQQGNYDQAMSAFRKAIADAKGRHALAYNALGMLQKQNGDLKGATASYKQAILQSADSLPVVHYNLGIALEKMDDSRNAVQEYKIYLAQAPHGFNAQRAKARLRSLGVDAP